MDQDEFVETSDPEEIEESQATKWAYWQIVISDQNIYHRDDDHSPRKRVKVEHITQELLKTPRHVPCPPPITRTHSSSQSTAFLESTPSACLTMGRSPKSSSMLATPPASYVDENNPPWDMTLDPFEENSQDPLLLSGHDVKLPCCSVLSRSGSISSTTAHSREPEMQAKKVSVFPDPDEPLDTFGRSLLGSRSRSRSQSVDPLYLASSSPGNPKDQTSLDVAHDPEPASAIKSSSNLDDLHFTPPKNTPSHVPSSPLTPPPASREQEPMPTPRTSLSAHSSPLPHPVYQAEGPHDLPHLDNPEPIQVINPTRYSLRARQAKQLNPYAYDKIQYKQQLRSNPDAIVKIISPMKGGHHHGHQRDYEDEDAETQEYWEVDGYDLEDQSWEEGRRRGNAGGWSNAPVDVQVGIDAASVLYPEALQDLPSTDEEEAREARALSKEARRMLRERRAKEKREAMEAKAKAKSRRNAISFPMSRQFMSKGRSPNRGVGHVEVELTGNDVSHTSRSSSLLCGNSLDPLPYSSRKLRSTTPAFATREVLAVVDINDGLSSHSPVGSSGYCEDGIDMGAGFDEYQHYGTPGDIHWNTRNASVFDDDDDKSHSPRRPPSRARESDGASDSSRASSSGSLRVKDAKERKRLRVYKRMVPAVMVNRHFEKPQKPLQPQARRQRSVTNQSESEAEEGPLLPGQTRARRAEHPGDVKDIRGDTESSEDERDSAVSLDDEPVLIHSASDVEIIHPRRPGKQRLPNIVNFSDSQDDSSSSDSGMDDEEIKAYLEDETPRLRKRVHWTRIREESLIDWMLTRTRTVGGKKKPREQTKVPFGHGNDRKASVRAIHPIDIVMRGGRNHGTGRQTLLSFDKPLKATHSGRGHRVSYWRSATAADEDRPDDVHKPNVNVHRVQGQGASSKAVMKKKNKEKRDRAKAQGLYTFAANGTRITSGRRGLNAITIDVRDEDFHKALAPLSPDWAKAADRPHIKRQSTHKARSSCEPHMSADAPLYDEEPPRPDDRVPKSDRHRVIKRDFGIPFLPSGISFGQNTYIGRGWLHDLVNLVSRVADPPMPFAYTAFEFEFGPHMNVPQFSTLLVEICDRLLEFATSLPDEDSAEQTKLWHGIMRVVCQLVSWFLGSAGEVDRALLRGVVKEQILNLVTRMQKLSLVNSSMDMMTFGFCWFAVELSARLGCRLPKYRMRPTETNPLVESVSLLVQHLLIYGLEKTMEPIQNYERGLDGSSISQRTAELWICLLHLVENCRNLDEQDTSPVHPVWQMVQENLQPDTPTRQSSLEASESTWRTIFSLCALSQFSAHGMTTGTSRLPASWKLVAFALKQIRLVAEPGSDQSLSAPSLDKRDEYIGLIAARCLHLCSCWHWRLDDASVIFNQLVDIFRSRKFANLRQEPADFPAFMLHSDLQLLAEYKRSDTVFVVFLKLIIQASRTDCYDENPPRSLSPKIKKLLSLAIPVGSVPFSKKSPPSVHELSMLYNRFSAVAVAIHLDPAAYRSRITHARSYVNFKEADDTTRTACIRGMMYFSILMVYRQIPLDESLIWFGDMVEALLCEHAKLTSSILEHHKSTAKDREQCSVMARDRVVFLIPILLGSARRIIESYGINPSTSQDYPDPGLLSYVTPIFRNTHLANVAKAALEMRRLLQAFLNARTAVMPMPQRPRVLPSVVPDDDNQENQDDYGTFELDLNDPELLAALSDIVESPLAHGWKAKDRLVCDVIDTHIYPVVYRLLCKYFRDPPSTVSFGDYCRGMDCWIDCWLGCANIVVQNRKKTWSMYLDRRADAWGKITNEILRRRVDLRVMHTLLRLDPMAYLTYNDCFIEVLLESLVSAKITIENEYFSLILSIDGVQHMLLRGVPCRPVPGTTDYKFSTAEFSTLRLQVLEAIFSNLDQRLRKEAGGDMSSSQDNQKHVGFLTNMFKAMRSAYEGIELGSEGHHVYADWCRQVFQTVERHLEVKSQQRLLYWVNWGRTLE